MMSSNTLPPSFKVCATCALWAGIRSPYALRNYVTFEMDQTGECCGGGFNRAQLNPMASCAQWQKWPVLNG